MNKLFLLGTLFSLLFFTASSAFAMSDPPIFSCTSPIGIIKSHFESGAHGVPGNYTTLTGADTVYQIDDDHILQCLCLANSVEGIQSNWWKAVGLSQSDIAYFQRRGWVYVPEGKLWGLAETPYLVKNDAFKCDNGSGGVVLSSTTGVADGSVLGMSSLGQTGSTMQLLQLLSIGALSGFLAYRLTRV